MVVVVLVMVGVVTLVVICGDGTGGGSGRSGCSIQVVSMVVIERIIVVRTAITVTCC